MRDLLYKNLTSSDRSRKVIASCEIADKEGVHSVVRRHFTCLVKYLDGSNTVNPNHYFYVRKERSTKEKREHFFCKVKGSILAVNKGKLFAVLFIHTLNIELTATNHKLGEQVG